MGAQAGDYRYRSLGPPGVGGGRMLPSDRDPGNVVSGSRLLENYLSQEHLRPTEGRRGGTCSEPAH